MASHQVVWRGATPRPLLWGAHMVAVPLITLLVGRTDRMLPLSAFLLVWASTRLAMWQRLHLSVPRHHLDLHARVAAAPR